MEGGYGRYGREKVAGAWRRSGGTDDPVGQLCAVRADRQSPHGFRPDLLRRRQARRHGQTRCRLSLEDGQKATRACAINVLAQVKAALGDLDKVVRVVRLGGFVNSAPNFLEGPKVMNGASDLMVAAFGDKGKHARSTIGVAVLPLDSAMEVEALFEVS